MAMSHPFYIQASADYGSVDIQDNTFNPSVMSLTGGAWVRQGIAVELEYGQGVVDDDAGGLTVDVPSFGALAVRFQSPEDFGIKAHFTAGYGWFNLEGEFNDSSYPGDETFSGPMVGLGLLFPIRAAYPWSVALEYGQTFGDDNVDMGTIGMGLRYGY